MFNRILLIFIFLLISISSGYSLDVCSKIYTSNINGEYYDIGFMCGPFSPIYSGYAYIVKADITVGVYYFHQNPRDPIINLGDFGVFYQSPSDVLTFIPPPFIVFNVK
jgi:hypothetical protein